ncbi:GNAT family N-acetyltransferase [Candidatus Saccharibacteria bacterium]|nr:GNAT family N-acetyltransferase [Candidatus Saccharibacteria bacterium]
MKRLTGEQIKFKKLNPSDTLLLEKVALLILTALAGEPPNDTETLDRITDELMERDTIIAVSGRGEVLATGSLDRLDNDNATVCNVVTSPEVRGCGLGSAVLKLIEEQASQEHTTQIILFPTYTSQEFYQHRGYTEDPLSGNYSKVVTPVAKLPSQ